MDFENDFFKGRVVFLMKTDPEDPVYGAFFHGKQRLFEMQIQGHFKKLPEGKRMELRRERGGGLSVVMLRGRSCAWWWW